MVSSDSKQALYSELIQEQLETFVQLKIDVRRYFQSNLPVYQVERYPQYHEDHRTTYSAVPYDLNTFPLIEENYPLVVEQMLLKE